MTAYADFLASKSRANKPSGFEPRCPISRALFPFQRELVRRALKLGRSAIFADCGLGKTFMQIEWAEHVSSVARKPVLILAPLAVAEQTVREGLKLSRVIHHVSKQPDSLKSYGLFITNYEKLHLFDASAFCGIVLDECFAPGTMIETNSFKNGIAIKKDIRHIRPYEKVLNASGTDTVQDVYRREINRAVKVSFKGKTVICSENHPWFTQRGWVGAKHLSRFDSLVESSEAMRMVREDLCSSLASKRSRTFLREVLLSEMANESRILQKANLHAGTPSKDHGGDQDICQLGSPFCNSSQGTMPNNESHDRSKSQSQGEPRIEGHEAQTFRTWREREGYDEAAIAALGGSTEWMGERVSLITGKTESRLSHALQVGLGESILEDQYRGRRHDASFAERVGRETGQNAGFVRLEGVEILERGNPDLEQFADAEGRIYFYDLSLSQHPSFSVEGVLVHNSSILKNFNGATRNAIIDAFAKTPYKLACTATPSPNDFMELGNHAEFLNVMSRAEMLSMFFVHDGGETQKWRIKRHATKDFWAWVASWSVMLRKPSDLGFSQDGYDLPPLTIKQVCVEARNHGDALFALPACSLSERLQARKHSIEERIQVAADIANSSDEQFLVWCNLNAESEGVTAKVKGAVEVTGSDSDETKTQNIFGFIDGKFRVLVSKSSICGYGLNLQCCRNIIYLGLSDSFEDYYQSLRRTYRFGQQRPVRVTIVTSDIEGAVVENIKRKQADAEYMASEMASQLKVNLHLRRMA